MGERSNIVIEQYDGSRVYLYGHWMGDNALQVVADVLDKGQRWSDAPYLTRIIFDRMTKDAADPYTGFGISTYMTDNDYPVFVMNPDKRTIHLEDSKGKRISAKTGFANYIQVMPHNKFDNLLVAMNHDRFPFPDET